MLSRQQKPLPNPQPNPQAQLVDVGGVWAVVRVWAVWEILAQLRSILALWEQDQGRLRQEDCSEQLLACRRSGGRPQPVVEAADAAQRPSQEPCHPLSEVRLELPPIWQAVTVGFLWQEVLRLTLEVAQCSMACSVQVLDWEHRRLLHLQLRTGCSLLGALHQCWVESYRRFRS